MKTIDKKPNVLEVQSTDTFEEYIQYLVGSTYDLEDIINNLSIDEIKEEVRNYTIDVIHKAINDSLIKHGIGSNTSAQFVNDWVENNLPKNR